MIYSTTPSQNYLFRSRVGPIFCVREMPSMNGRIYIYIYGPVKTEGRDRAMAGRWWTFLGKMSCARMGKARRRFPSET